jgi:predicted phosphodiesterase
MTRIAVLSDIHANLPALEAVIDDLQPLDVAQVVVAGDVINWGPYNVQVLERVTALGWAVLRGNHEYYLLDYDTPRAPDAWRTFVLPRYLNQQLAGTWKNRIAAWPEAISLRYPDAPPALVVHASPGDLYRGIYSISTDAEIETMLAGVKEETVVVGHTHLPLERQVGRWRVFNAGSVGVPLDRRPLACYLLLDGDSSGWRGTLRRVPYDISAVERYFEQVDYIGQVGAEARLILEEFRTATPYIYPFNVWQSQHCPDAPRTLDLAERFLREVSDIEPYLPEAYKLVHLNGQG